MIQKKFKFLLLAFFSFSCLISGYAQKSEYKGEIGGMLGGALYTGDAEGRYPEDVTLFYGALFRYKFNTRVALRAEFSRAKAEGVYSYNNSVTEYSFSNQLSIVDFCGEFNFFDYEINKYNRYSSRVSPYIFAGVGTMLYNFNNAGVHTKATIPFGLGVKVKIAPRWNANLQYTARLLLGDSMEGVPLLNNPAGLNGSNFMNNDLLSTLSVGISYDILKKKCNCPLDKGGY